MGRTNPTFRDYLARYEERWAPFRRALRRRHQDDFDRLFDRAREHADAAGHANATDPETAILLSILLAQERDLRRLRERLEAGTVGEPSTASPGTDTGAGDSTDETRRHDDSVHDDSVHDDPTHAP